MCSCQPVPTGSCSRARARLPDARRRAGGYANGRLPTAVLCELPGGSGERLRPDPAVAFLGLAAGYQAAFDKPICLTDGYRTLGQQQLRSSKPWFAARPGSNGHGWGLAVDLSCGVHSFGTERHAWMVENAREYG